MKIADLLKIKIMIKFFNSNYRIIKPLYYLGCLIYLALYILPYNNPKENYFSLSPYEIRKEQSITERLFIIQLFDLEAILFLLSLLIDQKSWTFVSIASLIFIFLHLVLMFTINPK